MAYIGQVPVPQSTERRVEITATSGQTSFSVGTYAVGFADFLLNGIRLQSDDVTATDGTTATLASGAAAGDVLTMVARTQTTDGSAGFATTSEVQGTHTTGSITSGTTALTVASATGISTGDYVVGEGITPGTIVSAGGGTTSLTLSANAGATLSSDPVGFYKSNKVLSPGLVAGGLCRAWVKFNSAGTILSSFNITGVTDEGGSYHEAEYTVNFVSGTMPDADYVITGAGQSPATQAWHMSVFGIDPDVDPTASACRITFRTIINDSSNSPEIALDTEPDLGCVAFFR